MLNSIKDKLGSLLFQPVTQQSILRETTTHLPLSLITDEYDEEYRVGESLELWVEQERDTREFFDRVQREGQGLPIAFLAVCTEIDRQENMAKNKNPKEQFDTGYSEAGLVHEIEQTREARVKTLLATLQGSAYRQYSHTNEYAFAERKAVALLNDVYHSPRSYQATSKGGTNLPDMPLDEASVRALRMAATGNRFEGLVTQKTEKFVKNKKKGI